MIKLSDQLFISLPLPLDAENCNVVMNGNIMIVETRSEYLLRVDFLSRYLGQQVDFLAPPGSYGSTDYINKINDGTITTNRYCFETGTHDEDFLPCVYCAGGGEGGDVYKALNNIFTGDNIHEGSEIFNEITYINPGSSTSWTTTVNNEGDLVWTSTECPDDTIMFTCEGIVVPGIIIPDEPNSIPTTDGGTIPIDSFLTECCPEEDPIYTAWYAGGTFPVNWEQIVNPPDCDCEGGTDTCNFTEQECINIRNLLGDPGESIDCTGLLHNELDGLQGGDILLDQFYHLTLAELEFVQDLVDNGSGVATLHTDLSDVSSNMTHQQIDDHINDATIHFLAGDVVANEEDPIFTAERDALTPTYVTMRGETTLIDSPMRIDEYAYHINDLPIFASHGNSNTSVGPGSGSTYEATAVGNVAFGVSAGQLIFNHISPNEFPMFGIYIGNGVYPSENNNTNETIIGVNIIGNGTNTVTIGNDNVTDNYFSGNIIIPGIFTGEKVEYGDTGIYITSDIDGNMVFLDNVVEKEYTLTELLGGSGGGWNLSANNDTSVPIVLDNTVSFNGDANISVERVEKDINVSLIPTGVEERFYISPNLVIDVNGRIVAAEDSGGCQQGVFDLGTQSSGTHELDLDNYPHAIIILESTGTVTIDFRHVVDGDTGHIEVSHSAETTLMFSASLAPDKTIHIANNSRQTTNTVLLSPFATIDVVAYWVARDRIHFAVIYDSIN